jgi:cobalt/nickel transport system permease protein
MLATLVLVGGIALLSPLKPAEAGALFGFLLVAALQAEIPLGLWLARSLAVLPVAASLALFSILREVALGNPTDPLRSWLAGGSTALGLVASAWLCVLACLLLSLVSPPADLLGAMKGLGMPSGLLGVLWFLFRFAETLREQLRAMRRALACRAPGLGPRGQVRIFGNLAGAMLLRAHDRGHRVHAAMLARGFQGEMPMAPPPPLGRLDLLTLGLPFLTLLALALARA